MDAKNSNNQSSNNSGDGRKALFTPVPEVDENGQTVSQGSSQPIASPGVSQPFFSQPVETGDIILNNGAPKPKQNIRLFIIGGLVMVLFVIVTTIIFAVAGGSSHNESNGSSTAVKSFNKYANYILYGKVSERDLDEPYDRWTAYEFDEQLQKDDAEFWNTATELLGKSVAAAAEFDNSTAYANLKNYQQNFLFFKQNFPSTEKVEEEIFDMFYKNGQTKTVEYVNSLYVVDAENDSSVTTSYIEAKQTQYQALIEYLEIYRRAGCMRSSGITEACTNLDKDKALELQEIMSSANEEAGAILDDLARTLVSDCWNIGKQLNDATKAGGKS